MADVSGPFTLDQLDQFGTIDSLAFSLDSDVWNTLTVFDAGGSVLSSATTSGTGLRERLVDGSVTGSGSVSSSAIRIQFADSSVSSSGAVSLDAIRIQFVDSSVNASATTSALAGVVFSADSSIISLLSK